MQYYLLKTQLNQILDHFSLSVTPFSDFSFGNNLSALTLFDPSKLQCCVLLGTVMHCTL